MIVDDEATVLKVMTRSLEKSGYRVIAAGDGEEAYALYSKYQEDIRLVITDLAMPGMDGPSLIAALRKNQPSCEGDLHQRTWIIHRKRIPDRS